MKKIIPIIVIGYCLIFTAEAFANGQWQTNGRLVCDEVRQQYQPQVISAGSGSVIVVWVDNRVFHPDIYAQKIDAQGNTLWAENGILVSNRANSVYYLHVFSDNAGGAIVVWEGGLAFEDVLAQRIMSDGSLPWPGNGMSVCALVHPKREPAAVPDGAGGLLVAWKDYRNFSLADMYVSRLDANGSIVSPWPAGGVPVSVSNGASTYDTAIASYGVGGSIVGWSDSRNPSENIYLQKIDPDGNTLWAENGIVVDLQLGADQFRPQLISDGAGGVIAGWVDFRLGDLPTSVYNLYLQRIDASGNTVWGSTAVPLGTIQLSPNAKIIPDNASGVIIGWEDDRAGNDNIYCQRIDSNGTILWQENGVPVCDRQFDQNSVSLATDGGNGALLAWSDYRDNYDIYSQRIDGNGSVQWEIDGIPVCREQDSQTKPHITTDGSGGSFIAWQDNRPSGLEDTYTQWLIRPAPQLAGVNPAQRARGKPATGISFSGNYFQDDKGFIQSVYLTKSGETDIPAYNIQIQSANAFTCDFNLALSTALGDWDIVAYDSLGQTSTVQTGLVFTVLDPQMTNLSWVSTSANDIFTGTQDNLVGQINCTADGYDSLQNITVTNQGTATSTQDIYQLALWHGTGGGAGGITFEQGSPQRLGYFTATGANTWELNSINHEILDNDALYITADIYGSAQVLRTCQFSLPMLSAEFSSGNTLPATALVSSTSQAIVRGTVFQLEIISSSAANIVKGQQNVELMQIVLTNISGGALPVTSLTLDLQDVNGVQHSFDSVFAGARLEEAGALTANLSAASATGNRFDFLTTLNVLPQEQRTFMLRANILDSPGLSRFQCGFVSGDRLDEGKYLASPGFGNTFPLFSNPINIRVPSLEGTFSSYPNPFRIGQTTAKVPYYMERSGRAKITVLSLSGDLVKVLVDDNQPAGLHQTTWDGRNDRGNTVISGSYLLRLEIAYADGGKKQQTRKIAVIR